MSSVHPSNHVSWPWFNQDWMMHFAEMFTPPSDLRQAINPWTFAGVIVNDTNSSNPAAERAVVSQVSYGQQLGRISDALTELIDELDAEKGPCIKSFLDMKQEIDGIKRESEGTRFEAVIEDLKRLRDSDKQRFDKCLREVAALGANP
jgi:hypothetical protein